MKRKLERLALMAMALGLLMVSQPWIHIFFSLGFVVILLGIILFNIAGRRKV